MNGVLTPERFAEFFAEANGGLQPFPWQTRLVRSLFESQGVWPDLLDLPTASGKTSTVDIALYTLAAGLPVPRRIVFVVDRRVIVQQAASHATDLRRVLRTGESRILNDVRDGLKALHADVNESRDCFAVAELRGAIQQDREWAERPDVPAVIAATVDQVGSRLLFRGYGVSDRMLPVHAGLFANDALILLDEVHLAKPFSDLLDQIRHHFRPSATGLPDRWGVVELSATPNRGQERVAFSLDDCDYAHPVLGQRLAAKKLARLATSNVPADTDKAQEVLARDHAKHVHKLLEHDKVQTIGVVVNRVRLATLVRNELRRSIGSESVVLLTGRMRGFERASAIKRVQERVGSKPSEERGDTGKFVVVATQTIEAGADLDFDVLVTDCASIDALIQRFGRVDRLGKLSSRIETDDERPRSVIVGTNRLSKDRDDPIYGEALASTWEWFSSCGREVDFAILGGDLPDAGDRADMVSPSSVGPVLTRSHLDRLVRTSPRPDADIDVDSFLHGIDHRPDQDVDVVWRVDISAAQLGCAATGSTQSAASALEDLRNLVVALPPSADEALSIPLSQARAWLARNRTDGLIPEGASRLSDVERTTDAGTFVRQLRPVLVWRAGSCEVVTTPSGIHAGDTLVVPADYGALAGDGCWDPVSMDPVSDVAEIAAVNAGRFRLRLNPATLDPAEFPKSGLPLEAELAGKSPQHRLSLLREALESPVFADDGTVTILGRIPTPDSLEEQGEPVPAVLREWLRQFTPQSVSSHENPGASELKEQSISSLQKKLRLQNIQVVMSQFGSKVYLLSDRVAPGDIDSDPGRSCGIAVEYPLDAHLRDVARWAREFLNVVGVGDDLAESVVTAGLFHDLGKADTRFQSYLRNGRVVPADKPLLAKSAIPAQDRLRNNQARARSGYPADLRHEAASVALSEDQIGLLREPQLARFLIAAHHGYSRPFFPPQIDPENRDVEYSGELGTFATRQPYRSGALGSQSADDFFGVTSRYGWFGSSWIEAILRLADHGASREASNRHGPGDRTERD